MILRVTIVLALALAACRSTYGPTIVTVFAGTGWTADDQKRVSDGETVWSRLGYLYAPSSTLPECPRYWYKTKTKSCKLTVVLTREDVAAEFHDDRIAAVTSQDQRTVKVGTTWRGWDLVSIVAHEFGHLLMDCHHLAAGVAGVMQPAGDSFTPTQADYDLGCATIGICVKLPD